RSRLARHGAAAGAVVPAESGSSSRLDTAQRVHLVGIGGSAMSTLADLLLAQGKTVSGSDLSAAAIDRLARAGVRASLGHRAEQVNDADLVVVTAAAAADNPE